MLSLTGNIVQSLSGNNMLGTMTLEEPMKKKLIDKLLIPCVQRNWEELYHNYLLWNTRLSNSFEGPENEIYRYFLQSLELMVNRQKKECADLQMVYILPPIKLKPEYEIHRLLFGSKFDKRRLDQIGVLLKREGITIDKIKELCK